ncbi:ImmA/IrrE family metallo-endopeptidase [Paenibacillus sp. SYP-B3998]|uniref:ImmA/IrrE family metallo-endopeptidase n=1 Tax=Paenibacillus sp. SYP-B3998 TaxID=2678564 RepID=A0A6G4A0E2_9BACL|nr:ImmA/IrrE family metallo-endopeptidase [Paenibacillus sp. SYP-B3998]NEW07117.1 ImmA/IrrE family metallo-endopeptidase [Paenibacillus sp. SYP-B3998]
MFSNYQTTPLEQWIEALYHQHQLTQPNQLQIVNLASKLNIWTYFTDMNSMAVENNGLFSINLDRRLSAREQWEDFLHEVCHLLRHAGNQMTMPDQYVGWQEQDAAAFQLYAAMPISMIKQIQLPERKSEMIEALSEEFQVTYRLAAARLEQIQRRIFQGIMDQEFHLFIKNQTSSYHPANWSDATRSIMEKLEQLKRKGASTNGKAHHPV